MSIRIASLVTLIVAFAQTGAFAQPTISSFTPTSATVGESVTIDGTNFNGTVGNNTVFFGATQATVTATAATGTVTTSLTAIVPSGATFGPISVTVANLTAISTQFFLPTFAATVPGIDPTTLAATVDFTAGTAPAWVAFGDLDGDGKPDLAVTNATSNTVSVYRNTSASGAVDASSFAAKVDFTTGTTPRSVEIGDVDGDGKLDLVVTNAAVGTNTVSVLRNTSTSGTIDGSSFAAKVDYATAAGSYSVGIGDLDGDGRPDLAVTDNGAAKVSVFRNTSTPGTIDGSSFAAKVDFTTGTNPRSVAIGDVDGDGKLDLSVANNGSNTVSVLRNTSAPGTIDGSSFAAKVDFTTGTGPLYVEIGDVDGDGKLDLAVANFGAGSGTTVSVFRNTSTSGTIDGSSFAASVDFTTGTGPRSVGIGDVNGDGKPDLAVTNDGSNTVSVFRNTSTSGTIDASSFAAKADFTTGTNPYSVAIGDVDGDNKPDLVIANNVGAKISVLRNQTLTAPLPTITTFTPASANVGASVTINGTAFSATAGNNTVFFGATKATVTATSATGTITTSLTATVPSGATFGPLKVTVASRTATSTEFFLPTFAATVPGIDPTTLAAKVDLTAGTNPEGIATGDVDGDGKPDLVVANIGANTMSVFRNTSTSADTVTFAAKVDFATGSAPFRVAIGDVDGDGKPDVAITDTTSNTVSVFRNTSNSGSVTFAARVDVTTGSQPRGLAMGDVDGDGKLDIAAGNYSDNTLSVFRSTSSPGTISFGPEVTFPSGDGPQDLMMGDVDGDGKPDLAVTNHNASTVSVFRNTSTPGMINASSFAAKVDFTTGTSPECVSMGDLDGDGKLDLSVANGGSGVSVFHNTSTTGVIDASSFAAKVDLYTADNNPIGVAIGDVDGDGKPDIVATLYFGGGVSVYRNTSSSGVINSGSFAAKVDFTSGGSATVVAVGDMDGDGKPDVAVANYDAATVSVFRNQTLTTPLPTITSFTPTSANVGAPVTITGTNFSATAGNNTVFFGATKATVTAASTTSLTVTVPSGATFGPLRVTVANRTAASKQFFLPTFTAVSPGIGSNTLATKVDFVGGNDPEAIVIADLDGDGKVDLAVGNTAGGQNSVSVYRNTTTTGAISGSSFADSVNFETGGNARVLAVGDVDGDGKPDLVATDDNVTAVSVLRNTSTPGTLSFAAKVDFGTGTSPVGVAVGDVDGDGRPDLAVVNYSDDNLSLFRNTCSPGTVSFSTRVDFSTGSGPHSVAMADVDRDGKIDVVVSNSGLNSVSVYLNTASPGTITSSSLDAPVDLTTDSDPRKVAIGDVDGDGKPEIVVVNTGNGTGNTVSIFGNTCSLGTISFGAKVDFTTGTAPTGVALGDMNGDAKPELAVANFGSNSVSVFRNTSILDTIDGLSLADRVDFTTGTQPSSLALGDLDEDGKPDVATSNAGASTISVLRNLDPLFPEVAGAAGVADAGDGVGAAWGDYDADGDQDLFVTNNGSASRLYRNNGDGSFTDVAASAFGGAAKPVVTVAGPSGVGEAAIWGDYDKDGDLDLYVTFWGAGNALFRNDGNDTFTDVTSTADVGDGTTNHVGAAWGDYDNDGNLDLYVANDGSANRLYHNNGDGTFTEVGASAGVDDAGNGIGVAWGDYDNDGKLDLYLVNNGSENRLYHNNGGGSFTEVGPGAGVANNGGGYSAAWGDYDNDGDLDLYVVNDGSANRLYRNNGSGTFTEVGASAGVSPIRNGRGAAWADYDRDGKLDLYVTNADSTALLYRNNGNGTFTEVGTSLGVNDQGGGTGAAWADYDGDGDLDLYKARSNQPNRLYQNSGNTNHWLTVKLAGTTSSSEGIGTRVVAVTGATRRRRDVDGGSGYNSQPSLPVEFGFGATTTVDSLIVKWPSGAVQVQLNVATNQTLTVGEIPPAPQLTIPDSAAVGRPVPFTLSWNSVPGASTYRIQVSTNNAFTAIAMDTTQSATSGDTSYVGTSKVVRGLFSMTTYYWRVQATNGNGTGVFSAARSFTTGLFNEVGSAAGVNDGGIGRGVSWVDFDGDGDLDLYLANSAGGTSRLYRNDNNGSFTEVGADAGVENAGLSPHCPVWADYDNDGDLDLYQVISGVANRLYRNNGDNTFTDVASSAGVQANTGATDYNAAWADYDRDGHVDLYVGGDASALFHNNGDGTFTDVTTASGVTGGGITVLGVAWADYDGDDDLDLYVSRASGQADRLFRNNGDGTFTDVASGAGLGDTGSGAGVAWGDYDNDGDPDLYLVVFGGANKLYRNNGNGTFSDVTTGAGVAGNGSGQGVAWADWDNDGDLDLYVSNYDSLPDLCYRNNGNGTFTEVGAGIGVTDAASNTGVTWGDYNQDGFPDLYVASDGANVLFRNLGNQNHWLELKLIASDISRDAIGARVTAVTGSTRRRRDVDGGSGYFSQPSLPVEFGLANAALVDSLIIRWARGNVNTYTNVGVGQVLTLTELARPSLTSPANASPGQSVHPALSWGGVTGATSYRLQVATDAGFANVVHQENSIVGDSTTITANDLNPLTTYFWRVRAQTGSTSSSFSASYSFTTGFFNEVGTPAGITSVANWMGAAWGDYDNDGDQDLYLLRDGSPSLLYRNNGNGTFAEVSSTAGVNASGTFRSAVWGDYDNDGKLDLYVVVYGGANLLYRNNGDGTFTNTAASAGVNNNNTGAGAAWADYDGDGNLDLFVANSNQADILYHNNGDGTFSNTAAVAGVNNIGPATGVGWGDYDNDGDLDLYVTHYQAENNLYRNNGNGTFSDVAGAAGVNTNGGGFGAAWGDYDNDGRLDLFVGMGDVTYTNPMSGGSNLLYHNNGNGTFTNVASSAGVNDGRNARQVAWVDYDNDGDQDLFVSNTAGADRLYRNNGDGTFTDAAPSLGVDDPGNGHGAAWADYNNDGYPDLYVSDFGQPNRLFRNLGSANRWLTVKLVGTASGRDGIGARVTAVTGSLRQQRDMKGGEGFVSQPALPMTFGFGAATAVDTLIVRWPSGFVQRLTNVPNNQTLTVTESHRPMLRGFGGALDFDGGDFVSVNDSPSLKPGSAITLSAWVRPRTSPGAYQYILGKEGAGGTDYVLALTSANQVHVRFNTTASWHAFTTNFAVPLNQWHHIAVTYDGVAVKVYLDGRLRHTETWSEPLSFTGTNVLDIGRRPDGQMPFNGVIDEVQVWSVARTLAEMQGDLKWELTGTETGLAGYWRFNEGLGTLLRDRTANANLGTLGTGSAQPTWTDTRVTSGGVMSGLLRGVDADGQALTISLVGTASKGAVSLTNTSTGDFTYTPALHAAGVDSFFFRATDGTLADTSTVRVILSPTFAEVSAAAGVDNNANSVGVAWGDYNKDGALDLYVTSQGSPNKLYRNNGNGTFSDVAASAGVDYSGTGVSAAWADYDNDGALDLYATNQGSANKLYRNNGNGTFAEVGTGAGVTNTGANGSGVAWGDCNQDGYLDLYVTNQGSANKLYRNNGNGTFAEVGAAAGVDNNAAGISSAWGDYDNDGDLDLYVTNQGSANKLYRNNGNGTFTEVGSGAGVDNNANGYAAAWGDYDNDGDLDLYVTSDGSPNKLYRNNGNGTFTEVGASAGVGNTGNGRGAFWGDYDNDGNLDLYVTNYGQPGNLYLSNGNGTFFRVGAIVGVDDPGGGYGAAWGDYDNDGFLDLYTAKFASPNKLYRNNGNANRWLAVRTVGTAGNRDGIGARVTAVAGSLRQRRDVDGGGSFAQPSLPVEFGFGGAPTVDTLIVRWPSGAVNQITNVATNQTLTATEQVVQLSSASLAFGNVERWSSGNATLKVKNIGGAGLTITGIVSTSGQFSASPVSFTLAAGDSQAVTVTFSPTALGPLAGTLTLSQSIGPPSVVTVLGTGIDTTPPPAPSGLVATAGNNSALLRWLSGGAPDLSHYVIYRSATNNFTPAPVDSIARVGRPDTTFTNTGLISGTYYFKVAATDSLGNRGSVSLQATATIAPVLALSPATLSLGNVTVGGAAATQTFTVSNTGTDILRVTSITKAGTDTAQFSVGPTAFTILPGGSPQSVVVTFSPTGGPGARSASLSISHNASGSPAALPVSGSSLAPSISLPDTALHFPDTPVAGVSTLNLTVENQGTANLTIASITVMGTDSSLFAATITSRTVPSGQRATVAVVSFAPTTSGPKSAILSIAHNAAGSPSTVSVTGTGQPGHLRVFTTSLNFGEVEVGKGKTLGLTLGNPGPGPLSVRSITSERDRFAVSDTSFSIPANTGKEVSISFSPLAEGVLTGMLTIYSNDPDRASVQVSLSGTGIVIRPVSGVSPDRLDFGRVEVGQKKTLALRVSNTGRASLLVQEVSVNQARFTVAPDSFRVAPNATRDLPVIFTPVTSDSLSALLTIRTNDPATPERQVLLTGRGQVPLPVVDFRATNASGQPLSGGRAPLSVRFVVTNTGGPVRGYSWSFGDSAGAVATADSVVTHVYRALGAFTVVLTAAGPDGSVTRSKENLITVLQAVTAEFGANPLTGRPPVTVSFADSSQGLVTSRLWTFGDGDSSTAQSPPHVYRTPGIYSVRLTVRGLEGYSDTREKADLIRVSPVADFAASPLSGTDTLTVAFADSSQGATSWRWAFGDGDSSTVRNPRHFYRTPGVYTVRLTVASPGGSDTKERAAFIEVKRGIHADFSVLRNASTSGTISFAASADPVRGRSPLTVAFRDSSRGEIRGWSWAFGDGDTSAVQHPSHTYTRVDSFSVTLRVTGPAGSDAKTVQNLVIVVPNRPPSPPTPLAPADSAAGVSLAPRLAWGRSADPENDPITYDLFVNGALVRSAPDTALSIGPLAENTDYTWRVAARDNQGGVTQGPSRRFRTVGDTQPPVVLEGPSVEAVTQNGATLLWVTDEPSRSQGEFRLRGGATFTPTPQDTVLTRTHRVGLAGLTPNGTYEVRVVSRDPAGNFSTFPAGPPYPGFTTLAARDTIPPQVTVPPSAPFVSDTTAVVAWGTDEPGSSEAGFRLESDTTSVSAAPGEPGTEHRVTLTGLHPASAYVIRVRSADASGNVGFGPPLRVVTPARSATAARLRVSGVSVEGRTESQAIVAWSTDRPGSSVVRYGLTPLLAPSLTQAGEGGALEHRVTLTRLTPATGYYFTAISSGSGGSDSSEVESFHTETTARTRPPVILEGPLAEGIGEGRAKVVWKTDEVSTSAVDFDTSAAGFSRTASVSGSDREHGVTLTGLSPGTTYFCRVRSEGPARLPVVSGVLRFLTLASRDTVPPTVLEGPSVTVRSSAGFTVEWGTDEISTSEVVYGPPDSLTQVRTVSGLVQRHRVTVTDLRSATRYGFRVRSEDSAENIVESADQMVWTLADSLVDRTAPRLVSPPSVAGVTQQTATVVWGTDEPSNSLVSFGKTAEDMSEVQGEARAYGTGHGVTLTNLASATTYHYRVSSTDASGNGPTRNAGDLAFTTRAAPDTLSARIVSGPTVVSVTDRAAALEWTTDELGDAQVEFASGADTTASRLRQQVASSEAATNHRVTLTNLTPDTTYAFRVSTQDQAHNARTFSAGRTFRTPAAPDSLPPDLEGVPSIAEVTSTAGTLVWTTDEPTNAVVEYGAADYGGRVERGELERSHGVTLTGLQPDTGYRYRITSRDREGNGVTTDPTVTLPPPRTRLRSSDLRFRTARVADTTPPVIVEGPAVSISGNNVGVRWVTDELSNSRVIFANPEDFGHPALEQEAFDGRMVTVHLITLAELNLNSQYKFRSVSSDASGNTVSSGTPRAGKPVDGGGLGLQPPGGNGSFVTAPQADRQPPVILSGPTLVSSSSNSLTLEWRTDEASDSFVEYGTEGKTGSRSEEGTPVTRHRLVLTKLAPGTFYTFAAGSTDPSKNGPTRSKPAVGSTTAEVDVTPPRFVGEPTVVYKNDRQAVIGWRTDEQGNSAVTFRTGPDPAQTRTIPEPVTDHRVTLTNLSAGRAYTYEVSSTDLSNNGPTQSGTLAFSTDPAPDVTPPKIPEEPKASAITEASATVRWQTDELSDSAVRFGTAAASLDFNVGSAEAVTDHRVTLTNLKPATAYFLQVNSIDRSGNGPTLSPSAGRTISFTTATARDTLAPARVRFVLGLAGSRMVLLNWPSSPEPDLTGYNVYRGAGDAALRLIASNLTEARFRDEGLADGTVYRYAVTALDGAGNEGPRSDEAALTPSAQGVPTTPKYRALEGKPQTPTFVVENAKSGRGEALTYVFQVSSREDFADVVVSESGVKEGSGTGEKGLTAWTVSRELTDGATYYLRVRASDGTFDGPYMPPFAFRVDAGAAERPGDFTGDFTVDFDDFFAFAAAFGSKATGDNARFDLDKSGDIGFGDFFSFVVLFGKHYLRP